MEKELITIEKLNEIGDVYKAIEFVQNNYPELPTFRPKKPFIHNNATSDEVLKYAELLRDWESDMLEYHKQMSIHKNKISEINSILTEFIKEQAGIEIVPPQYRDKVFSRAYEDGHSYGYYEVYQKLCSLISIFE